jgi:cellobiose phosphorylase
MGMRPDLHGLRIAPAIPSEWKEMEISKNFRGKHLTIKVQNPNGAEGGYKEVYLNGEKLAENYVPADQLKDENEVIFVMS